MTQYIINAIEKRRSYYDISNQPVLSDEEIISLVQHAVKYAPSAYNSQSARLVVLLKKEHEKLWDITAEILKARLSDKAFPRTKQKLDTFRKGYGTILYFEEQDTVRDLQQRFPLYSDHYPMWSQQSSGMLQYAIWVLLESAGYGASLQHYNPLIDERVRSEWNLPENWKLISQMVFGKPVSEPEDKSFLPLEERIRVFR